MWAALRQTVRRRAPCNGLNPHVSRVRELDRKAPLRAIPTHHATILLVEGDGVEAAALRARLLTKVTCQIEPCTTLEEVRAALARARPTLAIAGHAGAQEALRLLVTRAVPTVLFAAALDPRIVGEGANTSLVDHVDSDAPDALDRLMERVARLLGNRAIPVLVADDSPTARATLVEILRRQNYHTIEAASGAEALEILAEVDGIEMVVTDYHMPDMDGLALTREIRRHRDPSRVRIIGISASTDPALSAQFLKAGASDFIYRPFVAEEVWLRIRHGLETLEQIRRLRDLAERDPLTGLYNRRAFFEQAHSQTAALRVDPGEDGGGVAILDIDHFKRVNDTYGHDTGDTVIREVAGVLGRIAHRERFLTARFGGEEFVLLMSDFDVAEVHAICEEVRTTVQALTFTSSSEAFSVTVSIGVARLQLTEGIDNNLNAADQMLYMAKGGGRNQVFSDATFSRL